MRFVRVVMLASSILYAAAFPALAEDEAVRWKATSAYPLSTPLLGPLGKDVVARIETVSNGNIEIALFEPGALVPALQAFEAVSLGALDAAWSTPGYWAGKEPALQIFAAVPFGPEAVEYLAWFYYGGGKELYDDIYRRFDLHSVMCALIPPEASGWFREPVTSLDDFRGMKMRFFGLGARVMDKLGVSTQLLAVGDIYPALELGTIDATEFSMPAIDVRLGFDEVAKHYYFPGWHQQSSFLELLINLDQWNALTDTQRAQIETVCGDSIRRSLAEGEALQIEALAQLEKKGVVLHKWSDEFLAAFEAAWHEVVIEQSNADKDFARVWNSLSKFREKHERWQDLGYLPR